MKRKFVQTAIIGMTLTLARPLLAQRGQGGGQGASQGVGVGRVAGSVTGTATGAVNGTVSQAPGKSGRSEANTPGQEGSNHGANVGGASADVSLRVSQNAGLSTQLQPLVPVGATLAGAAAGFRNEGQFVAALHVAHNLNIPFDQLKARMTGSDPVSLGKAIQALRPTLDDKAVKNNTKLADRQVERDLEQSQSAGKPDRMATRIASNTALASRLGALLPQGATVESAATGFKNEGQFIATLEAAKNLNLSFADLKDRVTAGQPLGEAIHALRPNLTEEAADNAAVQAEEQARVVRAGTPESARR